MQEPLDSIKDPASYTWITYVWVILLASLGGLVNYARRAKMGYPQRWTIVEFVGELATSAFTGLLTFYLCEYAHIRPLLTAALVGISGHMGSRLLYQLEMLLRKRVSTLLDESPPK